MSVTFRKSVSPTWQQRELHNIIAEAKGDLAQLEAQMLDYEKQFNLKQKAKANKNQA